GGGGGGGADRRGRGGGEQGREGEGGGVGREGGAGPGPGRAGEERGGGPRGREAPHQGRARGGGGKRASGAWSEKRRSGASGVVEQVGPALEAGVDDPAIGDEAGEGIPQSLPPPAGQLGVLPTQVLDVGGEVEGDELGLLGRLAQQRFSVLVGAQAGEGGAGIGGRHSRRTIEAPRHHHP